MSDDRLSQADLDRIIADPRRATQEDAERMALELREGAEETQRDAVIAGLMRERDALQSEITATLDQTSLELEAERKARCPECLGTSIIRPTNMSSRPCPSCDGTGSMAEKYRRDLRFLVANLQRMDGAHPFSDQGYSIRDSELMGWEGPRVVTWGEGCNVIREMIEKYGEASDG